MTRVPPGCRRPVIEANAPRVHRRTATRYSPGCGASSKAGRRAARRLLDVGPGRRPFRGAPRFFAARSSRNPPARTHGLDPPRARRTRSRGGSAFLVRSRARGDHPARGRGLISPQGVALDGGQLRDHYVRFGGRLRLVVLDHLDETVQLLLELADPLLQLGLPTPAREIPAPVEVGATFDVGTGNLRGRLALPAHPARDTRLAMRRGPHRPRAGSMRCAG